MFFNAYALLYYKETNVMALDTEREKEIGLGPQYPFDPLDVGECIVSSEY